MCKKIKDTSKAASRISQEDFKRAIGAEEFLPKTDSEKVKFNKPPMIENKKRKN